MPLLQGLDVEGQGVRVRHVRGPAQHAVRSHAYQKRGAPACGPMPGGLAGGQPTKKAVWHAEFEDDPEVLRRVSLELRGMVPAVYSDCAPSYSQAYENHASYAGVGARIADMQVRPVKSYAEALVSAEPEDRARVAIVEGRAGEPRATRGR